MGLLDAIRSGTYVPDGEGSPPPEVRPTTSTAEIADRVAAGEAVLPLVRDLLDQAQRADSESLRRMLADAPVRTGDPRADALLAGIAEYLVVDRGLPAVGWVSDPALALDRFWFVSDVPGFEAIALAQTPIALKRRGILWPRRSLERV
ncbi:hypothetical protein [Gaiella sp.]|jgi:hypothetical protein|uniref:hypothetical protein n=1 Tax=Gaiella sp. TaxID=2663207 RepID=UPI002E31D942|nr:hypothetical protein [Gaiella sp.]HEX5582056.1 hypothetical protein [Gaiella sp.]